MLQRILGQFGLISHPESFIKRGLMCLWRHIKEDPVMCRATLLFLLGQEHSLIIGRWSPPQLCIRSCVSAAAHFRDRLTDWLTDCDSCMSKMKMLWLSLLCLMMPSKTPVTALPLRTTDLPTGPNDGLSEADQEFAEVFICLYAWPLWERMTSSQLDWQVSLLG